MLLFLRKVVLFQEAPESFRQQLCDAVVPAEYSGGLLYRQGDPGATPRRFQTSKLLSKLYFILPTTLKGNGIDGLQATSNGPPNPCDGLHPGLRLDVARATRPTRDVEMRRVDVHRSVGTPREVHPPRSVAAGNSHRPGGPRPERRKKA